MATDNENVKRILEQLSLREPLKMLTMYCNHNNEMSCKSCMSGIRGNVSGIRGNVSDIRGNMSGIWGNVSDIWGNMSGIWGNVSGIRGNVSGIIRILLKNKVD